MYRRVSNVWAFLWLLLCTSCLALSTAGIAGPPEPKVLHPLPPKLVVVLSVDQFSADLFSEYRAHFTGGLRRLQSGVVFPQAYQGHATTETCPGHSTILTGSYPARTGIIANDWSIPGLPREDRTVYCVEDPTRSGSSSRNYFVSARNLLVPTLGDRLKAISPQSRVVAVSGKDRSAVLLAGPSADETWWWDKDKFASFPGAPVVADVAAANRQLAAELAVPAAPRTLPEFCSQHARAVSVGDREGLGVGRFARAPGDVLGFRASPALDAAIAELAFARFNTLQLGRGVATDILAIGLSATDYIGHTYGTSGSEMCLNMAALDETIGLLLDRLDASGLDYLLVLTADHGGLDLPERSVLQSGQEAKRVGAELSAGAISERISRETGRKGPLLLGAVAGDVWLAESLKGAVRQRIAHRAINLFRADPSVHAVFDRKTILASPMPSGPPDNWTVLERVRASYHPTLSGDFYVVLKPRRTAIASQSGSYLAMHGSPWGYDRRVPLLFWRRGMAGFEQPLAVASVDILPTIASLIGLEIPPTDIDGRCLDLIPGRPDNCVQTVFSTKEK